MFDLSTSETVYMVATIFVIVCVAVLGLVLLAILAPERLLATSEQMTPAWSAGELGTDYAYREPADESYVDALTRVRGSAPTLAAPAPVSPTALAAELSEIVHSFDPQPVHNAPEPLGHVADELATALRPTYSVTLAELRESSRYAIPVSPAPATVPSHHSGTIDTAGRHGAHVGRHRAPTTTAPRRELVAA